MSEVDDTDDQKSFVLQLTHHDDDTYSFEFKFDRENDPAIAAQNKENDGELNSETTMIDETSSEEKVPRKHKVPSPSDKFERLSIDWVATSIGFFESIPNLVDQNFRFARQDMVDQLRSFAEEHHYSFEHFEDEETKVDEYELDIEDLSRVGRIIGKSTQAMQAASTMNRSTLGALVSEYEAFLASVLRVAGEVQPNAFINDEDTISVGDLSNFENLKDVRRELVSNKIDELLHAKSHVQVLKTTGEKFGVNLTSAKELLADFTEICQRRHLLTHAGGFVNKRYLRLCHEGGCRKESLPKLGEKVAIDRKYIRRATARVFQIGFFSLHIIWQKLIPKDHEQSCGAVLTASHDFLENDLTKMTRRLADFVLMGKVRPTERHQAYLTVNKALSFLFDPLLEEKERSENVAAVLSKRDWTIVSPTLKLALACIERDYSNLAKLSEAAAADGVTYHNAHTWEVFREVRELPDFVRHFKLDK